MKSLERNFIKIAERNPPWSSYMCFAVAVTKRNFQESIISRWFSKLVDKDDYAKRDKREVLRHLQRLSKPTEENKN